MRPTPGPRFPTRERLPAASQTDDLTVDLAGPIDHCFDDGIQAGHVTSTGQNADAFCWQGILLGMNFYYTENSSGSLNDHARGLILAAE